jgi:hypothetical protein
VVGVMVVVCRVGGTVVFRVRVREAAAGEGVVAAGWSFRSAGALSALPSRGGRAGGEGGGARVRPVSCSDR